uniref:Uncharacterized protein n=1 Tax=Nelumbo nucifera TaxID=4432 RepID=A0A822Y649_NELNU|nr:TPA_asm: hypothetical protein HUJ06_028569 [Nelumbo nucifera]
MEALGEGVDHRSASVGRTSGQVTGIALRGTVEPITLQAGQAALSAELSRMSQLVGLRATCHDQEALALAAVVALDGNLVTGFAPGQAATSTTLLVGWNVTDATLQGTPVTNLHIEHKFSNFGYD